MHTQLFDCAFILFSTKKFKLNDVQNVEHSLTYQYHKQSILASYERNEPN